MGSHEAHPTPPAARVRVRSQAGGAYQPPSFEVIELACEITAYAPAGDEPLF